MGHQPPGVEHVLGPEKPLRPLDARLEFDTEEITDFAVDAIPYASLKLTFGIRDHYAGVHRERGIHLKAGTCQGDIFQISDKALDLA